MLFLTVEHQLIPKMVGNNTLNDIVGKNAFSNLLNIIEYFMLQRQSNE